MYVAAASFRIFGRNSVNTPSQNFRISRYFQPEFAMKDYFSEAGTEPMDLADFEVFWLKTSTSWFR